MGATSYPSFIYTHVTKEGGAFLTVVNTINLGRIRPVHRGAWLQTNSYVFLDFVTSRGSSYICTKIEGVPSGISITDTIYWTLLASKGADATWVPATLEEVNLSISSTKPITPATLQKANKTAGEPGGTGATGKEGMSVTGATINANGELILTIDYRA